MSWWLNRRYRIAFFFGKKEHFFSRLLFVCLLITLGIAYFGVLNLIRIMLIVDICIWLLYWFCHRMEKWAYPNSVRH